MKRFLAGFVLATIASVAGCGETDPYIYKPREFDRKDEAFNKPVTDRKRLTICYSGIENTDQEVLAQAEAECARFGKRASPLSEGFGPCPLLTPIAAQFRCDAPADTLGADEPRPEPKAAPVSETP